MANPRRSVGRQDGNTIAKPATHVPPDSLLLGPWQLNAAIGLLFIVATALLYSGDLGLGFFRVDDPQYVLGNTWIQSVTWEHVGQILSSPYYLNYSPIHLFSYKIGR